MKTSHLVLALSLLGSSAGAAQQAQVSIPRASTQVAAATVALPIGVFAGIGLGMLTPADSADRQVAQIIGGIAGGVTGAVVGPAIAVRMIGTGGARHGSGSDAVAGTMAGYAADVILDGIVAAASRSHENRVLKTTAFFANFVLPAVGATLAYDLSRR
jgi:hypothetical protein